MYFIGSCANTHTHTHLSLFLAHNMWLGDFGQNHRSRICHLLHDLGFMIIDCTCAGEVVVLYFCLKREIKTNKQINRAESS